jgi:hypothetical protein
MFPSFLTQGNSHVWRVFFRYEFRYVVGLQKPVVIFCVFAVKYLVLESGLAWRYYYTIIFRMCLVRTVHLLFRLGVIIPVSLCPSSQMQ